LGDDRADVVIPRPPSAVLLDRDGVINEPVNDPTSGTPESPYHPEDVTLVDGVASAIRALRRSGIPVAVVSNQPAAAKQTHSLADLAAVDAEVRRLLAAEGVEIPVWRYCHHHPDGTDPDLGIRCACRKPQPGLLVGALEALGVPVTPDVVIVGDSDADIGAGKAIGISTILVEHPATAHRRVALEEPQLRVRSADEWSKVLVPDG
jgi:D-glycero-D-manno-heptose 1,7-bisphosphate phosphatase